MTTSADLEAHHFRFKEHQPPWRTIKPADSCSLKCVVCKGVFPLAAWELEEDGVECELCGTHDAIFCPGCEEAYDNMHGTSHLQVLP